MNNAKGASGGSGITTGLRRAGLGRPPVALAVASMSVLAMVFTVASARGQDPGPPPAHQHPSPSAPTAVPGTGARYNITTFARVPEPGHPFGVLPAGKVVYVTTGGGNPTTVNTKGERVFTYSHRGRLLDTKPVGVAAPNMGLYGLARDAKGRLYVGDMNGRILRYRVKKNGKPTGDGEVYATVPPPYSLGGWYASMWNGIAFDRKGNLYVSDSQSPTIWRIPPNGEPEIYFRDPRLAGGPPGGPFGAAIGPDGKLYITVLGSALPGNSNDGIIYRLALSERPTALDLETVHVFRASGEKPLQGPMGLAFGKSGRLYVALGFAYQLVVLAPDGKELRRISSPMFATPTGLAFHGRSLLVANADFAPEERDKWRILRVWVDDRGVAPIRPSF